MRVAFLVAVVLFASAPTSLGQAGDANAPLLTDPEGDMRYGVRQGTDGPRTDIPVGQGHWSGGDLVSLRLGETLDDFTFTLEVASLNTQPTGSFTNTFLSFHDVRYRIGMGYFILASGDEDSVATLAVERDESWRHIALFRPTLDLSAGTYTLTIPRAYFLDAEGRMPVLGDAFEGIYTETPMQLFVATTSDRMPDDGDVRYEIREGGAQAGHLRLVAYDPVRVSNGESSTFIYHLGVENLGDAEDTVRLAPKDAPEGWRLDIEASVKVAAKSKKDVVLLASIPFKHEHGGFASFSVEATSPRDPNAKASAVMGILHTPIPQPAGHHSEIYLHTDDPIRHPILGQVNGIVSPSSIATMNADPDHTNDATNEVYGNNWCQVGEAETCIGWWIPLDPGLQMGLDFDLTRKAHLKGVVEGPFLQMEGTFEAEVHLQRTDGTFTTLAAGTMPFAATANAPASFDLTLDVLPEADYIPYAPGQNLILEMEFLGGPTPGMVATRVTGRPFIHADSFVLHLPLFEYSDPVVARPEAQGLVTLLANGLLDKLGKPGATLTYPMTLTNQGATSETFLVDLAGNDADRAKLAPGNRFTLEPGQSAALTLGVVVPPEANDQQSYEVLVVARAESDPTVVAIVRTRSTAVLENEAAVDEADLFAAAQGPAETPGLPLLAALGAVAALALVRRRR